jgi:hypothetical protein
MTNPFMPEIFPSPSHFAHTSAASAFRTNRPCELWYCISCSRSPSHSSRVSACPIVPDISLVSSSSYSYSTTNFHFVRRAYCMRVCFKTQDIVVKKGVAEIYVHVPSMSSNADMRLGKNSFLRRHQNILNEINLEREVLQVWRLDLISCADAPRPIDFRTVQVAPV